MEGELVDTRSIFVSRRKMVVAPVEVILGIKKRGNNLEVRLLASVAKAANLHPDQMARVSVTDDSVTITPIDGLELTLEQRLTLFDPSKHGGEVMTAEPLGAEKW